jgi:hypothetical protein
MNGVKRKCNVVEGGGEGGRRKAETSTRNSPQYFETKNWKQNKTKVLLC